MMIESIHIDCFGCLTDFSCSFDGRLNIIEGENESGKSTLAAFIRYMLYGFTGRAGTSELAEKQKRVNWERGRAAGSMTVRVGESRYRIERSTTVITGARGKESYRDTHSIINLENRMPLSGNESAGERFLGVGETLFLNTAFVTQVSARIGAGELNEAIENLLFSGDESLNVQKALSHLEGLRKHLLHKNGKGGALYELEVRAGELEERLAAAERQNVQLLAEEAELAAATRRLHEAEKKADAAAARETEEKSALTLAAYARLHEAEKTLAEEEGVLRNMNGLPAYRLHESDLTDLALARRTVEDAERRYREAVARRAAYSGAGLSRETTTYLEKTERIGSTTALRAKATAEKKSRLLYAIGGGAAAALGLLFLILSLAAPTLFSGFTALPLTLAVLGLAGGGALGVLALRAHLSLSALYRAYGVLKYEEFLVRMEEVDKGREDVNAYRTAAREAYEAETKAGAEYNRSLAELDTVVRRFDARLPEEDIGPFLDTLTDNARQVMVQKKEHEATILRAQSAVDTLSEQLVGTNEAAERANLPLDRQINLDEIDLNQRKREKEHCAAQARVLAERVRQLERSVTALRAGGQDPALLQAELDGLREQIAAVREQHAACVLAYEAISGAGERLRREVSPRLSDFSGRMMEGLTEGKYTHIGINSDLGVSFATGDSTYAVDYMSTGAQDLTYLSLRMALIDLLYKEKPPVCFDESFAYQDDGRTARILTALAERAAEGQQNLIFTCHTREGEVARRLLPEVNVIRLGAGAAE